VDRLRKAATQNKSARAFSQNLNKSNIVKVCTKAAYQLGLQHVCDRIAEPVSETEGAVGAHWGDRGLPPRAEPYFSNNQASPTQPAAVPILTVLPP
jgi:hypothetical protein